MHHMTNHIHIGGLTKEPPTSPLKHLPNRLDAQACLALLERISHEWTAAGITAAGKQLDVAEADSCLEYTALSLEDKIVFKAALSEHGLITRGKRLS
jgi:hypothetical protein